MSKELFGTDGYRGVANSSPETGINPTTFGALAYESAGLAVEQHDRRPVFVVGRDTRESGPELLDAVCEGAVAAGAEVWDMGIAPTPVIAWAAKRYSAHAISITASHNPAEDNGFKLFGVGGVKPDKLTQDEVEKRYYDSLDSSGHLAKTISGTGRRLPRPDLQDKYLTDVVSRLGGEGALADKMVVVDGANGAVHNLAPRLYRALGAQVYEFACADDGANINNKNGATHLDSVKALIKSQGLAASDGFLGAFASDGDGDRVMGVDRLGRTLDGNHWLRQLAIGQIGIVGTIYTNTALRRELNNMGVEFHECDNGDSNVTAMLHKLGLTRGGEFTGHLIDLGHLPSGDGLYMGAWLATRAAQVGISLAEVYDELGELWPGKMVNVDTRGANAKAMVNDPAVRDAIEKEKTALGNTGRILVRPSGTQPVVRVYVELEDGEHLDTVAGRVADVLQAA